MVRLSADRRGHNDKDPALTLDRDGRLWVAWQSYVPQVDRILARPLVDGEPGELFEVSDEAGVNFQPAIACDGDNAVWVLWSAKRAGRWHILARAIDGGRMGLVVSLDESAELACYPSATADADGRVWAAWTACHDRRHQVIGSFLAGGRWSAPVILSDGPGEHYRPVLCADREGAWLAYETRLRGTYELYLCRWLPAGPGPSSRFSLTGSWELHPRLCADGAGGVWATWIATHDVRDGRGVVDHKVEIMAAHYDGARWTPYRSPDHTKTAGYVAHLYDGLLGRKSYWGFVGHRRRPQIVRTEDGDVWVLYERKEDESINRHGPDALFYATPLTQRGRGRTVEVDTDAYAYTVNGDLPVVAGRLAFAGQIPEGAFYGDICAGTLSLNTLRPVRPRPASNWRSWQPVSLQAPPDEPRPTMQVDGVTYTLYWGDTHCHGNCSGDAEGEIDESYAYGRYRSGLDFMAVTDNDFIYDDTLTTSAWALLRAQAGHYSDPGRFVTFSGYERTYRDPTGEREGPNHRLILFADDEQPLHRFTEPDADSLIKFVARMEGTNAFVYPHHPTWWIAPCSRLGGVEVCSSWDVYIDKADTIRRALQEGYRLAFIGSSDTHRIVPGQGGALTGVWARELTREGILEALRARRCYATNGERIVLDVRVEGAPMGSADIVGDEVTVQVRARAPRTIRYIDLFRDGEQVLRRTVDDVQTDLALEDRPAPGEHFYHIRVQMERLPRAALRGVTGNLQAARGEFAWSSPVWVQTVDAK